MDINLEFSENDDDNINDNNIINNDQIIDQFGNIHNGNDGENGEILNPPSIPTQSTSLHTINNNNNIQDLINELNDEIGKWEK